MTQRPSDRQTQTRNLLNEDLSKLEDILQGDVLTIFGPIRPGLENIIRDNIERLRNRRDRIAVVLDTVGGIVEVVERMVTVIRHHYNEVYFIVPNRAMSAGTVFVMAADQIFMNYFSCLGPIDPQTACRIRLTPRLCLPIRLKLRKVRTKPKRSKHKRARGQI